MARYTKEGRLIDDNKLAENYRFRQNLSHPSELDKKVRTGSGRVLRTASKDTAEDKTSKYKSSATVVKGDNVYVKENKGTIRNNKTPAQVKAQLERIRKMEAELAQRDGNGRTTNFNRLRRAESAAQAFKDYNALGAVAG